MNTNRIWYSKISFFLMTNYYSNMNLFMNESHWNRRHTREFLSSCSYIFPPPFLYMYMLILSIFEYKIEWIWNIWSFINWSFIGNSTFGQSEIVCHARASNKSAPEDSFKAWFANRGETPFGQIPFIHEISLMGDNNFGRARQETQPKGESGKVSCTWI